MHKVFHKYHLLSFFVSVQAYLFSTFINATAAKLNFTFTHIGIINLVSSFVYALASITIGHSGYKIGYKRMMSLLFTYLLFVSFYGFTVRTPYALTVFAILQGAFFGSFFPQVEGLIAKSESTLGIDPPSITGRFTLSWSTGNILGVTFGPYLTVRLPFIIFLVGLILSTSSAILISKDNKKNGDLINFRPLTKLTQHTYNSFIVHNSKLMKKLRLEYRIILFLGGLVYTSVLADFPKLIVLAGLNLDKAGFLIVGANIGVFLTFVLLQYWKDWVGNEKLCALLLLVVPMTGILAIFAKSPLLFFITALFAGFSYAVPYTFAIFYGLLSETEAHGKQGALHEMVIGMLFGVGPFLGGLLLDRFNGNTGLVVYALAISLAIYSIQLFFNKFYLLKSQN
ncbi:MAG: MFS transporter [Fervidobacterium sp.]|uniref:MFS transporter n=1 Tax=Fervidobacterium sp. TaxID=1871331 RepID=UPI00404B1EEA